MSYQSSPVHSDAMALDLPQLACHAGGFLRVVAAWWLHDVQSEVPEMISDGLRTAERHTVLVDKLNRRFAQSFEG